MSILQQFKGSLVFSAFCLIIAGWLGWNEGGVGVALTMVFITFVLGVMETSLSLDNAVVNATVLKDMDPIWQKRFLTWGIAIAVFGMRVIFPLAIVSVAAWVTPWEALQIALRDRQRYEDVVTGAHIGISGFGGAFLLLVGLSFFISHEKEHHWLHFLEKPALRLLALPFAPYAVAAALLLLASLICPAEERKPFLIASFSGVAAYLAVEKLGDLMSVEDAQGKVARSGLASFIYLEFLDASFSFDGVIGAFAITNDILIIALGLGIGAMFVRSMTVFLVRGGHMSQFRYLEHGAFWAIMALAFIMLLSIRFYIPEVVTGLIGALFIGLAWRSSVRHRAAYPHEYEEEAS